MPTWRYTTVTANRTEGGDYSVSMRDGSGSDQSLIQGRNKLTTYLNHLGSEGWELCHSISNEDGGTVTLIFRQSS